MRLPIRTLLVGHVWRRHSVTVERYVVILGKTVMPRLRLPHPIDVTTRRLHHHPAGAQA